MNDNVLSRIAEALERIAPPLVKFEFWENTGHGMKAVKPAEYIQALEAWLRQ